MVRDKRAAEVVARKIEAKLVLGEFEFTPINHKPSTHESYKSALDVHIYPVHGNQRHPIYPPFKIKRGIKENP
jgi:hypothetical protein